MANNSSSSHPKVTAMRAKLSMAKEMLEELLSERDEMEARHAEEIAQREAQVAAGEEERGLLRSELDTLKKRIDEKQRRMKDASQQAVQTKAVVRTYNTILILTADNLTGATGGAGATREASRYTRSSYTRRSAFTGSEG